jgi:hypothetical protein
LIEPNLEDYMEPTQGKLGLESGSNIIDPLLEPVGENIVIPLEPETRNRTYIRRDPLTGKNDLKKIK